MTKNDVGECDSLFIKWLINQKKISEEKIRRSFVNYTSMQL